MTLQGQRLRIEMNNPGVPGGQPVSVVNAGGDELGRYATVIDAYHAKTLMENDPAMAGISEGASGIRDDITTDPQIRPSDPSGGTPHPGTTATDSPSPFGYDDAIEMDPDLSGGAATGYQTPNYGKGYTTPFTQHWGGGTVNPMNYSNPDITPPPGLHHIKVRD